MSNSQRRFLESGGLKDHNGSGVDLGFSFTTESDLDHNLWFNPEEAKKDLTFLLKVHQGELSPALSRLALKAVTYPLFKELFYGEDATAETRQEVSEIPKRNAELLDAYLDRVDDTNTDQAMLKQAIDDATVLQLGLDGETVLLPAGPEEDQGNRPTSFTVLRRQSLGRALLYVSSVRPVSHIHTPQANAHRIPIRPADLLSDGATRFDLAEALVAQQHDDISPEEITLVETAEAQVRQAIAAHFDYIQPQSR